MDQLGWIKLHRKLLTWEWFKEPETLQLFIYLIIKANHTDKKWKGIEVKRGQLVTGRKQLASELGTTERKIRTHLNRLKASNDIASKATNKFTIITICNYDSYQSKQEKSDQQPTSETTSKPSNEIPKNDQQSDQQKEDVTLYLAKNYKAGSSQTDQQSDQQKEENRPAKRPMTDHKQEGKEEKKEFLPPTPFSEFDDLKSFFKSEKNNRFVNFPILSKGKTARSTKELVKEHEKWFDYCKNSRPDVLAKSTKEQWQHFEQFWTPYMEYKPKTNSKVIPIKPQKDKYDDLLGDEEAYRQHVQNGGSQL